MNWQTTPPPNGQIVEVEHEGKVIRVRAIWGHDGTVPHWESEDRNFHWSTNAFARWREIEKESSVREWYGD